MNRREALQAVVALATGRWAADGYDPDEIDGWESAGGGVHTTGRFDAAALLACVRGPVTLVEMDSERFDSRSVSIGYAPGEVHIDIEGRADEISGGALATFAPEQAREVAASIYMAAEELERRGGTDE